MPFADETASTDLGHGLGGYVSGLRPDNVNRTPGNHDQVDVHVTRLEQHVTRAGLLLRTISHEAGEQLVTQLWRRGLGRYERAILLHGPAGGAPCLPVRRRGPRAGGRPLSPP